MDRVFRSGRNFLLHDTGVRWGLLGLIEDCAKMITRNHILAAVAAFAVVGYISYLRTPAYDWTAPVANSERIKVGEMVRVDFKIRSRDTCTLELTTYAERATATGVIQLPALAFERKLIKGSPDVRSSFYTVTFPPGTEPHEYNVFRRIRSDCSWLDRIWPRVLDTPGVKITVVP